MADLVFPRVVYFGPQVYGQWVCKVVEDAPTCEQALSEGWSLTPILVGQEPVSPPVPAPASEPEPVRRKPGRPRKDRT